ncbi:MAG: YoaK family protein [Bdellovibrionota bacterium]
MFRHHLYRAISPRTHLFWFLLSFLAGSVNAGGFLAAQRFVTHLTGFATLFGIAAARGTWGSAFGILSVPVYFLGGVMLSAYFVDRRIYLNLRPRYGFVMSLVGGCLFLAALGGWLNWFGVFGHEPVLREDYFLLALLCGASGLQNAAISTASGASVRTTHLTGLTTDLGIGIVRAFYEPRRYKAEMKAAWLRVGTIVSFLGGSAVGAFVYMKGQYLGFLLPSALAFVAVAETQRSVRRLQRIQKLRKNQTLSGS